MRAGPRWHSLPNHTTGSCCLHVPRCPFRALAPRLVPSYGRSWPITKCVGADSAAGNDAQSPLVESSQVVQAVMGVLKGTRDLDSLLEYLPDEVIDRALAAKAADSKGHKPHLSFREVLDLDIDSGDWQLDTFAARHLIFSRPTSTTLLSSLLVTPERSVHRYEVQSPAGETCLLTITLALQETLQPQYRMSPRIAQCWRLRSIVGEAVLEELPTCKGVTFGPETVVEAQLEALKQQDAARVFSFASALNQEATGPLTQFEVLLQTPAYAPLLGFQRCERLKRMQLTADTYLELVAVVDQGPHGAQSHVYLFEVGQEPADSDVDPLCWATHAVRPLTDVTPLLGL